MSRRRLIAAARWCSVARDCPKNGAGWLAFFRDLTARGLSGVALVTSDAHRGLVEAIGATLPGAIGENAQCRRPEAARGGAVKPGRSV